MVAYGFKPTFVVDIQERIKRQTIRLPRRRHARPEERVQLFQGMRTKACRKIIPDPVCIGVDRLIIDTRSGKLDHVEVNGIVLPLGSDELAAFARADGFGRSDLPPVEVFGRWWAMVHGRVLHEDLVLIRWEDRP
ncbi:MULTISPECIES: ASCH domain-containing protein [unclassified Xanthobacter]|uniref:ASCH domain-containing protein n=1 Tax=unclassified Xanthobacter TaxID=2623496 RepID=UPI001F46AD7A|nr:MULTISPECIES: ASCH domain-containing protein [unclassified Xanthobacter]